MNKKEFKYIALAAIFAVIWFIFILPYLIKFMDGNNPFFQFLVFNVGLYVFLFIFLKAMTLDQKIDWKLSLGIVVLFVALDLWMPPYQVTLDGRLVGKNVITLAVSSSDYVAGLIGQSIGFGGLMLFIWTYLIVPFALLLLAAKLLPNFVRHI